MNRFIFSDVNDDLLCCIKEKSGKKVIFKFDLFINVSENIHLGHRKKSFWCKQRTNRNLK